MNNKFIIVKNKTNPLRPVKINETQQIIPADGKFYKLPYALAYKYREFLTPIRILVDETPEEEYYTTEIRNDLVKLDEVIKKPTATKTKKITKPKKKVIKKKSIPAPKKTPEPVEPTKEIE